VSASLAEVQEHADAILELLGVRMRSGQMVIHFNDDGRVQRVETNNVHKPKQGPLRKNPLDKEPPLSAG
jgi:hypothetical protein